MNEPAIIIVASVDVVCPIGGVERIEIRRGKRHGVVDVV